MSAPRSFLFSAPILQALLLAATTCAPAAERAPGATGPKLEGDVYKCSIRIDWSAAGETQRPDFTKAGFDVRLITYADAPDPDAPGEGPSTLGWQDLPSKTYPQGVVLFDLPKADLQDEHRQVIEVSIAATKEFRFRAKHEMPVSRKTVAALRMPLVVPLIPVRTRKVTVRVVSDLDGKPVPNEKIGCTSPDFGPDETKETGADGSVVFELDDDRSYQIDSSRLHGKFGTFLKGDELAALKEPLILRAPAPRLMGRVLVKDAGGDLRPLEGPAAQFGASASIHKPGQYSATWFVEGEMGGGAYAVYEALDPGEYHVHLPGEPPYSEYVIAEGRDFTVDASTKTPIRRDLVLKRAARVTLAVTVLDADGGKPIAGARVQAARLGETRAHSAETDAEGQATFRRALEGDYNIHVEAPGFHRRDELGLHVLGDHRREVRLVRIPPPRPKP